MDVLVVHMATLWVTHDPHEGLVASDQVSLISRGRGDSNRSLRCDLCTGSGWKRAAAAEFFRQRHVLTGTDGSGIDPCAPKTCECTELLRPRRRLRLPGERCRGICGRGPSLKGRRVLMHRAPRFFRKALVHSANPLDTPIAGLPVVAVVEGSREHD